MADPPGYVPGQAVDLAFADSIVTAVGRGWIRVQTASTEFTVDLDAVDVTVTTKGTVHCPDCGYPSPTCRDDHA